MSLMSIFNCCKSKKNEPEELKFNIASGELRLYNLLMVTENPTQINNPLLKFKKIKIQNLSIKKQHELTEVYKNKKIYKMNKNISLLKLEKNPNEIYYYEDTSIDKNKSIRTSTNNFLSSFLSAYNSHGDIIIIPDDIWIQISLFFSEYINSATNAEKIRYKLVNHEGKIELVVKEYPSNLKKSEELEYDWDYFFSEIIKQIESNTLDGIVEGFQSDFTTTNHIYRIISTAIIMNSFKQYFNYIRMSCLCGINNVYFAGVKKDWEKILTKLEFLSKFDSGDGILVEYIGKIKIIISKFIETFDNNVDVDFWNKIMTISEEKRSSSGGPNKINWIDGWILHFFGIYKKTDICDIPNYSISIPIKLINQFTGMEKNLILGGGWVGVSKLDNYTYKPDLGLSIINKEVFNNDIENIVSSLKNDVI